jgi:phage recombination protein Bet
MKKRKKKKARHHQKRPDRGTAIVKAEIVSPTVIRGARERELTQTEIDLVHRTVAKGTDEDQFALFLWFCRKHNLDPVAKEVYCILFNVTKHHQDEKGFWVPGKEMVILTGIGGLRGLAGRNYPLEYGSTDEPEFTFSGQKTPAGKLIPDTCTVRVWKKGATRPTSATLYWEEFAPHDLTDDRFKFWNKSPKNQLAKCTEGQALKKAYPDLANIYVTEELARRISEQTPSGREIIYADDQRPQIGSRESVEAIATLKAKGLWCEEHQCTRSASHLKECESSRVAQNGKEGVPGAAWKREADARADMPPIDVKPSQASPASRPNTSGKVPESEYKNENAPPATKPEPWKYNGQVEIDFSNEVWPIIRGDLSQIAEELKKACPTMDWGKDEFYHIQQRDLERLKQACLQLNYQVKEIFPKPSKSAETKPATKTKPAKQDSPGTRLAKGTITRVISGMTGKNNPLRHVTMLLPDKRKPTFSCFDTGLFEWLDKGNGKEAELYVQTRGKYTNIIGIKRCAGKEFDTDGKTPVIQRKDQEAGGKTLFG